MLADGRVLRESTEQLLLRWTNPSEIRRLVRRHGFTVLEEQQGFDEIRAAQPWRPHLDVGRDVRWPASVRTDWLTGEGLPVLLLRSCTAKVEKPLACTVALRQVVPFSNVLLA